MSEVLDILYFFVAVAVVMVPVGGVALGLTYAIHGRFPWR